MNYDPNLTNSGRMARQTVKLSFGLWRYRAELVVEVGGNCTGLTVIDCAVENVFESLGEGRYGEKEITMTAIDGSGDELLCSDDEGQDEEWLKDMLVSAEIIDIQPRK